MSTDHIVITNIHIGNLKPKCAKCGLPHKTKFCGVRCGYCFGMGHIENKCWKHGKDGKTSFSTNNYLEVLGDNAQMGGPICHRTKVPIYSKYWSDFEIYN
jgi:hypothetical protein